MKPTQSQVNALCQSLQTRYDDAKLKILSAEAKVFADYLNRLSGFKIVASPLLSRHQHVGRVIVDGVLQVGSGYEKQVRGVVNYIAGVSQAATVSGFIDFVRQHQKQRKPQFKVKNRETELLRVAEFFAGKGIETFHELYKWLEPESHRDSILTKTSGLQGIVFSIGDKTADYFRVLVGHWDAVAVDRGIRGLLKDALKDAVVSSKHDYKELRSIVQLTAVSHFYCRPLDLDKSIYSYYVSNKSGANKLPQGTGITALASGTFKYCIYCGVRMPHVASYCPKCGKPQL